MAKRPNKSTPGPTPVEEPRRAPRTVLSEQLLAGDRELLIQHGDDLYRLTVTRTGKLILHK